MRIRDEGANPRIIRHVVAENCCGNLTCEHHLSEFLPMWNALAIRWIFVLSQMSLIDRQPGYLV